MEELLDWYACKCCMCVAEMICYCCELIRFFFIIWINPSNRILSCFDETVDSNLIFSTVRWYLATWLWLCIIMNQFVSAFRIIVEPLSKFYRHAVTKSTASWFNIVSTCKVLCTSCCACLVCCDITEKNLMQRECSS